ncbi:MAG: LysR family transcriptional regulator [Hyphomicrobiaceae bacterium]|nr:LysR family transcriptional regulator [Hyphomicrobiaceae bacterium]
MNLSWVRDLEHLAQTGNFSRAAKLSHLSQPALSRRIKALEDWAGASLVDRSRHPVKLTGAGVQILEAGQQALSRLESERTGIREAQALPDRYTVKFAAQHSIGWRFYPAWLQSFESAFGPLMSRLRADDLPNCLQDLETGAVDFVVAYASRKASPIAGFRDIEGVRIGRDLLIPVARRGADGRPMFTLDRRNSVGIPFLRFGVTAPISQHIEPLLRTSGLRARLQVVYENSMGGALRIRVRDGTGLAWLPESLVAPDLEAGVLAQAGASRWQIPLDIMLYKMRQQENALIGKIWRFLKAREDSPLLSSEDAAHDPVRAASKRGRRLQGRSGHR